MHGALPTIVGGIRALLMQALHPAALAGVQQHSRYEQDALGRLAGTTQWLTVVTFGDRAAADRECARVRGMHRRVVGTYATADGPAPYAATDPDLLRWVHVAFTDSFLATHRVWGGEIPGGDDAYVREWAKAGELVGVDEPAPQRRRARGADRRLRPGAARRRGGPPHRRLRPPRADAHWPRVPAYSALFAGAVSTMPARHRELLGLPPLPAGRHPTAGRRPPRRPVAGPRAGVALAAGRPRTRVEEIGRGLRPPRRRAALMALGGHAAVFDLRDPLLG